MAPRKKVLEQRRKDKKALYFIMLMFPSLMLAMIARIDPYLTWLGLAVITFFFQAVLVKNFLDDYYGD